MAELVDQPTAAPTRKVAAGGIGGAIMFLVALCLKQFLGIELPDEVIAGSTAIVAFLFAYFVKESA